jgi:hypothetical protein
MYIRDKITIGLNLTGKTDGASSAISELEFSRLVTDMRDFLLVARHIEKRVQEGDDRLQGVVQSHWNRQMLVLKEDFDNKMS